MPVLASFIHWRIWCYLFLWMVSGCGHLYQDSQAFRDQANNDNISRNNISLVQTAAIRSPSVTEFVL